MRSRVKRSRNTWRLSRPILRARGKITAEVTGRLTESLGGVRVVGAVIVFAGVMVIAIFG